MKNFLHVKSYLGHLIGSSASAGSRPASYHILTHPIELPSANSRVTGPNLL